MSATDRRVTGRPVEMGAGGRAVCVLAPNPGPMTLDGTNTWVLREPGAARSVVVDPGPLHQGHLDAVAEVAGRVAVVLLTHRHGDHSDGARAFAAEMGCPLRAADPAYVQGAEPLQDGDVVETDGLALHVVATPGHTSDSVSFVLPTEGAILTGDTILGRGTTVVAHPDGALGPYLSSLRRMRSLAQRFDVAAIWPGHGPVIDSALPVIDGYLAHRESRLSQVRAALADGAESARDVVEVVYADVEPSLWSAAELSVRAQMAYLAETSLDDRPRADDE